MGKAILLSILLFTNIIKGVDTLQIQSYISTTYESEIPSDVHNNSRTILIGNIYLALDVNNSVKLPAGNWEGIYDDIYTLSNVDGTTYLNVNEDVVGSACIKLNDEFIDLYIFPHMSDDDTHRDIENNPRTILIGGVYLALDVNNSVKLPVGNWEGIYDDIYTLSNVDGTTYLNVNEDVVGSACIKLYDEFIDLYIYPHSDISDYPIYNK